MTDECIRDHSGGGVLHAHTGICIVFQNRIGECNRRADKAQYAVVAVVESQRRSSAIPDRGIRESRGGKILREDDVFPVARRRKSRRAVTIGIASVGIVDRVY